MKILFFGDVIGRPGRQALIQRLPDLQRHWKADFVIVNAENAAHGKGLTPRIAEELWDLGADVLTLGNHAFDRKEILPLLDDPRLLRPANLPPGAPGHGSGIFQSRTGIPVGVFQVMGRVHMQLSDCPFRAADQEIERLRKDARVCVADVHAEATSEKNALGWHLDGRVSAALGTHTHIQTADERVLPGGTAFISDAGACGPRNSVIGMAIPIAMTRFLKGLHAPFEVAEGDAQICGCVIDIDECTGKARSIERIRETVLVSG